MGFVIYSSLNMNFCKSTIQNLTALTLMNFDVSLTLNVNGFGMCILQRKPNILKPQLTTLVVRKIYQTYFEVAKHQGNVKHQVH